MHVTAYNAYVTAMTRANDYSLFRSQTQGHQNLFWSRPFVLTRQVEKDLLCKPLIEYFTEDTRNRFYF